LAHVNAHSLERQQQQAIDRSTQETHNALQLEEIKDELVCEIQLAMHGDARAVIVPWSPSHRWPAEVMK
jgi:hypothetical protein